MRTQSKDFYKYVTNFLRALNTFVNMNFRKTTIANRALVPSSVFSKVIAFPYVSKKCCVNQYKLLHCNKLIQKTFTSNKISRYYISPD